MNDMQKRLPESELEIMLVLWQAKAPLRTAEILQQLNNGWALATLKVLLDRLVQRGCVECTRDGRFTLYKAILQKENYQSREISGVINRYYESSAKNLIASLVRSERLSQQDLDEIAQMLKNAGDTNE